MFWIVQGNLFKESAFNDLIDALDRQDTQYQIVTIIPFCHELTEPVIVPPDSDVFTVGSTTLGIVCKANGWTPGYFDENLDYRLLNKHYGSLLMNHDMQVAKMRDIVDPPSQMFIRPVDDRKSFAGTVMSADDLVKWQHQLSVLQVENSYSTLTLDDYIVVSSVKRIFAEYRFFVVDGCVVTGSMYKRGNQVHYSDRVDSSIYDFAQQIVDIWQPNRAFALDIFATDNGLKVGEINSINSAGFYALDMGKFVAAINQMKFDR